MQKFIRYEKYVIVTFDDIRDESLSRFHLFTCFYRNMNLQNNQHAWELSRIREKKDEEEDDAKRRKEMGSSIVQKVWNVCEDGPERWVEVYGCATTTEEETQSLVKG